VLREGRGGRRQRPGAFSAKADDGSERAARGWWWPPVTAPPRLGGAR